MADHIFAIPKSGNFALLPTTANTTRDGASGSKVLLGTMKTLAEGGKGGFFTQVNLMPLGTNAGCVVRFFLNNGLSDTVAANNLFLDEIQLNSTTASEVAQLSSVPKPLPAIRAEAGWRLYATRSTFTAGNAGFAVGTEMMEF